MEVNLPAKNTPPPSNGVLKKIVHFLDRVVDPACKWGMYVSAFMLAVMMFLTFIDTLFGRLGKLPAINSRTDVFGPIVGGQEVTELLMLIVLVFGIAYCALRKGHIRVDLVLGYLPQKANLIFDIIAYFFSFAFFVLIAWQAVQFGLDNIKDKSVTTILQLPNTPFNFILALGAALTFLVFLRDLTTSIKKVIE
jgi:TRAP-type C4-dicarboxylate transport system permease small subunit